MKLSELRPCVSRKGKLVPVWYVVRVSQAMLNPGAANSTLGLLQYFGGLANPGALAVAEAISPSPDCVTILGDKEPSLMTELAICQECFLMKNLNMAVLMASVERKETDGARI